MQDLPDAQETSDSAALGPSFMTGQDLSVFAACSSPQAGQKLRLMMVLQCRAQPCAPSCLYTGLMEASWDLV